MIIERVIRDMDRHPMIPSGDENWHFNWLPFTLTCVVVECEKLIEPGIAWREFTLDSRQVIIPLAQAHFRAILRFIF